MSTKSSKSSTKAQKQSLPRRNCGVMSVHHWLLEQFPEFRVEQMAMEHSFAALRRTVQAAPKKPFMIPVVVHVLYSSPMQKISKAQVRGQIKVLNRDFRAANPDRNKTPAIWAGLVADPMIEFQLAKKDPAGRASDGIVYVPTTLAEFGQNDSMKSSARGGSNPWPTDKYLNIWVCILKDGLLGYAQFPGGPKATDGVVISTTAFGTVGTATAPFNLGRTCTHEVGHYFNLRHIWGDTEDCSGSDLVTDTPNSETPNYHQPTFPHISCQNGPNGDMFMNYMDYVDDAAMFMFTPEQVARMHATLRGPRRSLWQ
jgi:Pregnancy-associated plasma protein-A